MTERTLRTSCAAHSLALMVVLVAATAVSASWARSTDTKLGLVGYAVPREALGAIIKEWQKTPDGSSVSFSQSYGASGDQARAVANGLPADIVQLSTGLDVDYLVEKGLVDKNWNKQSYKGIVSNSLVVFAVRPGNPKKIKSWDDLVKPGVEVITANPFTSGAAKWNILAAYGAQRKLGKTDKQAQAYVLKLFKNVVVQAKSGRDATNAFLSGKGDVLLAYENEALLSRKNGQDIQFTIPKQTMLIETPIAVIKNEREQGQGEPVHPLHEVGHGAADLGGVGLPAGEQEDLPGSSRRSSRRARRSSGSATRSSAAAGRRPTRSGSTRTAASWSTSRRPSEAPLASALAAAARRAARSELTGRGRPPPSPSASSPSI